MAQRVADVSPVNLALGSMQFLMPSPQESPSQLIHVAIEFLWQIDYSQQICW
jgi:hypothetical protein